MNMNMTSAPFFLLGEMQNFALARLVSLISRPRPEASSFNLNGHPKSSTSDATVLMNWLNNTTSTATSPAVSSSNTIVRTAFNKFAIVNTIERTGALEYSILITELVPNAGTDLVIGTWIIDPVTISVPL